jgi:hypothetical protein
LKPTPQNNIPMRNDINVFAQKKDREAHINEVIGKVSRYYNHGEDFNAFSEEEQFFINVVGDAHRQMCDVENRANRNIVAKNLIATYKLSENDAYAMIRVASEVMLTLEYKDNGYLKHIMTIRIEKMMREAEKDKDFKSFIKLFDEYKALTGMNDEEAENLDAIFQQKLEFIPSKELLNQYFEEGMEDFDADMYVKKLEQKALNTLNGIAN